MTTMKVRRNGKGRSLKFREDRERIAKKIVRLRDNDEMSWYDISLEMPTYTSVPTVQALYDEIKGVGAHHGRLPGKGGRLPQ